MRVICEMNVSSFPRHLVIFLTIFFSICISILYFFYLYSIYFNVKIAFFQVAMHPATTLTFPAAHKLLYRPFLCSPYLHRGLLLLSLVEQESEVLTKLMESVFKLLSCWFLYSYLSGKTRPQAGQDTFLILFYLIT